MGHEWTREEWAELPCMTSCQSPANELNTSGFMAGQHLTISRKMYYEIKAKVWQDCEAKISKLYTLGLISTFLYVQGILLFWNFDEKKCELKQRNSDANWKGLWREIAKNDNRSGSGWQKRKQSYIKIVIHERWRNEKWRNGDEKTIEQSIQRENDIFRYKGRYTRMNSITHRES